MKTDLFFIHPSRFFIDLTHIAQLLPSNSLKFNHPIFQEALSGALQILT